MSTRVDGLWFEDGSLVLRAETKLFRLSTCLLAARSSFFKDLTMLPPLPESEMELIDGIPVVTLPDSAKDVEVFLRAIVDSSFFMPPPKTVQFYEVMGILRLSHKYDVRYLYCRALEHLSKRFYFPTVEAYRASKSIEHPWNIRFIGSYLRPVVPNASEFFELIGACKTVGADWLLPLAYYHACHYVEQLELLQSNSEEDERHSRLCLYGSRHLVAEMVAGCRFLTSVVGDCQAVDSKQCNRVRQLAMSYMLDRISNESDVTPLDLFIKDIGICLPSNEEDLERPTFCVSCHEAAKTEHNDFLDNCWHGLPSIFELPGWMDLEAMRQQTVFGENTTGDWDEA